MSCYTGGMEEHKEHERTQSKEQSQSEVKKQNEAKTQSKVKTQSDAEIQSEAKAQSEAKSSEDKGDGEVPDIKAVVKRESGEEKEGLQFEWKDILALTIAVIQVIFSRVVIGIGSFAIVIYLLGKFWLKCW